MQQRARSFTRTALYVSAGLLIWAANFLFTYVFAAVACARGSVPAGSTGLNPVSAIVLVSSTMAVIACGVTLYRALSRVRGRNRQAGAETDAFIDFMAGAVASLSMVAIIWTAFVAAVPVC